MPTRPLKIFVVENHKDTLAYLSGYLKDCGHDVHGVKEMTSALEFLASTDVDVLISDIGLPDGDGWQLLHRLREMNKPVPFSIAMSGYSTDADREKSRRAGFRHHLIKPFLPEELDLLLKQAVIRAEKI